MAIRIRTGLPGWHFTLAMVLLLVGQSAVASDAVERSVDTYIQSQMKQRHIAGLALAVIQNGRLQKTAAYGYANLDPKVPVTADTVFNVASITKAFTAVAVMQLVEAGKVGLDERVIAYLPDLPPQWHAVTVRQLLNHTSGLPDIMVNSHATDVIADTPQRA